MPLFPAIPEVAPFPTGMPGSDSDTDSQDSFCTIDSAGGPGVTLWSSRTSRTPGAQTRLQLRLAPEETAVIGRMNGGEIEYLDPRYEPTPILPGTGTTILQRNGAGADTYVSRGHFMLRGHRGGILLVNGVPRRGGGIRTPLNWTRLLLPEHRLLQSAEALLIEHGSSIAIELPNQSRLTIRAS